MEQIPLKRANSSEVINFYLFEHNVSGIGNFRLGRFYWRFTGHLCYRYIFYYFPNKILYLINPPVPEIWRPSGHGYVFLCHQQVIFNNVGWFFSCTIIVVFTKHQQPMLFCSQNQQSRRQLPFSHSFLSFRNDSIRLPWWKCLRFLTKIFTEGRGSNPIRLFPLEYRVTGTTLEEWPWCLA